MSADILGPAAASPPPSHGVCPVDHTILSQQKTVPQFESAGQPLERDAAGVWHIRSYALARTVLRSAVIKQAGFNAELLERMPQRMNRPILYQEGRPHHEQRKQTARFLRLRRSARTIGSLWRDLPSVPFISSNDNRTSISACFR